MLTLIGVAFFLVSATISVVFDELDRLPSHLVGIDGEVVVTACEHDPRNKLPDWRCHGVFNAEGGRQIERVDFD